MIKVSRAEWGARPPKFVPAGINTESGTDHWEGTTMGEFPHESCATKVQVIQDFHMDARGWSDIAYNFLVCPHGYVFIGRDHGVRSAANGTNIANDHSEAVCFIGGIGDTFTDAARQSLHEMNIEIGGITYPHQHWFNTACPGPDIHSWIDQGQPVPNLPTQPGDDNDVISLAMEWDSKGQLWEAGRGKNNEIYVHTWNPNSGWTDWTTIGGISTGGVCIAATEVTIKPEVGPEPRIDVATRGEENKMFRKWWTSSEGWSPWVDDGGDFQ